MLDLQAIEAKLAKGDPALKEVYLKLKAKAGGKTFSDEDQKILHEAAEEHGEVISFAESVKDMEEVTLVNVNPVVTPEGKIELEPTEPRVETDVFICSKCSKVCASNAGRAAHERKCKA